jgi:F-type H+-transporting ATPase subunit alpha
VHQFIRSKYADLWNRIETNKDLPEADEKALAAAIEDFKKTGTY